MGNFQGNFWTNGKMEAWTYGPNPQDPSGFARGQIKVKH